MSIKSEAQRFNDALDELKKLESDGYVVHGLSRLSLSSTGRAKPPEPVASATKDTVKTVRGVFLRDKEDPQS